jgi:aminoglycoside phosphotransferase (APT) family kinase protein
LLFAWLDANRPDDAGVPVITHGDLGFHNWLFDGDKPAVLLDWETVMLCSPAKDLANVRDVVVDAPRWGLFLQTYIAAGGSAADDRDMHYYGVLRQLQAVLCTSIAIEKMFTIADPLNADYLELGIGARAYFYASVAARLDALLASISKPPKG